MLRTALGESTASLDSTVRSARGALPGRGWQILALSPPFQACRSHVPWVTVLSPLPSSSLGTKGARSSVCPQGQPGVATGSQIRPSSPGAPRSPTVRVPQRMVSRQPARPPG